MLVKCPICNAGYDNATDGMFCPHAPLVVIPAPREQKVRVVTTTGWWFDMNKPPDFNMFNFVMSIRSTGYLINERIYQPAETISSIFVFDADMPPNQQTGVVIDFPGKPPK